MIRTLRPRRTASSEQRVLRLSLLVWAAAFTLLFSGLTWNMVFTAPASAPAVLAQYLAALLFGQVLGRTVFLWRVLPPTAKWIRIAALFTSVVTLQASVGLISFWFIQAAPGEPLIGDPLAFAERLSRTMMLFAWVYGAEIALIQLGISIGKIRDQTREIAEAKAEAAHAQLAMLRYQLNPHFLFNTLNAISSLVVTRRVEAAEEMIEKLSAFLRASLTSDPDGFVSLDEELSMVREYLDIETVRFRERLVTEFACDAHLAAMLVPSFILQPLVENAVKYAVGPALEPVTIRVEARLDGADLLLIVADDGAGEKTSTRGGTGVGLRNVTARLHAIYDEAASLQAVPLERGFLAIVRLPARDAAPGKAEAD